MGWLALGLWAFMNNPFGAQASSPPVSGQSQGTAAADEGTAGGDDSAASSLTGAGGAESTGAWSDAAPTEVPELAAAGGRPRQRTWELNAAVLRAAGA